MRLTKLIEENGGPKVLEGDTTKKIKYIITKKKIGPRRVWAPTWVHPFQLSTYIQDHDVKH